MSQDPAAARGYRFGLFEVECAAAALTKGGSTVRLRGKPFDILVYLLERPGELVPPTCGRPTPSWTSTTASTRP